MELSGDDLLGEGCMLGDGLLVSVIGESRTSSHVRLLELDGRERWRVLGRTPNAAPAGVGLIYLGIIIVDVNGKSIASFPGTYPAKRAHHEEWLSFAGEDLIFAANKSVLRARLDGKVLWSTELELGSTLERPEVAGGVVAVSTGRYSGSKEVCLLDAADGSVLLQAKATGAVTALCAAGPDAVVACSYARKLVGWRGLTSKTPERVALAHEDRVFEVVSPAPGFVVTQTGEELIFWHLDPA